jgi:uncharacterized membrane protein
MPESSWGKRFAIIRSRLYLYPEPEPLPHTRLFWVAMGLVSLLALAFTAYFIRYLLAQQAAFVSPAEDLGTMSQAIWSLTHGMLFHQTVCNPISDTNCYGLQGFSRFAIHFEPILFPYSLLYALWPSPNTLLIVQTVVVASGAFPAFWLARLRLRNEFIAVLIAGLYLLYPELQQAEAFYFHAVTMTAALLLFTLYFMYTRRTVWMFVFALLSMACKEEIFLVILMLGLWSIVFQRRWRSGLGLVGMAGAWVGLDLLIFHLFSPVGKPLLASRYAYLGQGPLEVLRTLVLHPIELLKAHLLDAEHSRYVRLLLAPAGYLPLLAPWVLVLAAPSIALNLLSSDRNQYLGVFQYNAEIVPVLIFSTIESLVLLLWLVQWVRDRLRPSPQGQTMASEDERIAPAAPKARQGWSAVFSFRHVQAALLVMLSLFLLFSVLRMDQTYGVLPFSRGFSLPEVTAHDELAAHFVNLIPASASVSAQDTLVPHVSNRTDVYLFPYGVGSADYIFLDVTSDSVYPYQPGQYLSAVKALLLHGNYGVVAAQDGLLLLKRGLPAPGLAPTSPIVDGSEAIPNLPPAFCSFLHVPEQQVASPMQADFSVPGQSSAALSLIGYQAALPDSFSIITRELQVTTYWRVNQANLPFLTVQMSLLNDAGRVMYESTDFSALHWCPTTTWAPGGVIALKTSVLYIGNIPNGRAHLALALLPGQAVFGTIASDKGGLPFRLVRAPGAVAALPGTHALQVQTFLVSW